SSLRRSQSIAASLSSSPPGPGSSLHNSQQRKRPRSPVATPPADIPTDMLEPKQKRARRASLLLDQGRRMMSKTNPDFVTAQKRLTSAIEEYEVCQVWCTCILVKLIAL